MNELQIFNNEEFGEIRTVDVNGKTYFVANDIAKALGYAVPKDAVSRHCKGALIHRYLTDGGEQQIKVIPEGDIYRLVIKSKLPSAEKFESWIFDEILPSIRKNGSYGIPKTTSGQIQLLAQGYTELEQKINEVSKDLEDFKTDLPLLAVECEKITRAVKLKGVECLGGRDSEAYADRSLSSKVYQDIHNEVKRQFGVTTYKAIKRSQCDEALEIIKAYSLPVVLRDAINNANSQRRCF